MKIERDRVYPHSKIKTHTQNFFDNPKEGSARQTQKNDINQDCEASKSMINIVETESFPNYMTDVVIIEIKQIIP